LAVKGTKGGVYNKKVVYWVFCARKRGLCPYRKREKGRNKRRTMWVEVWIRELCSFCVCL